jgi:preprotein translocase subunit YajC
MTGYGNHIPKYNIRANDIEIGDYLRTRDGLAGIVTEFYSENGNIVASLEGTTVKAVMASTDTVRVQNPTR